MKGHALKLQRIGGLHWIAFPLLVGFLAPGGGCSQHRPAPHVAPDGPIKLLDQPLGLGRLLVYSSSVPPALIKKDCIRGHGLIVYVVDGQGVDVWDSAYDEIDGPVSVDYSQCRQGVLRLTEWVYDPRDKDHEYVPFIEAIVRYWDVLHIHWGILLKPEQGGQERIEELVKAASKVIAMPASERCPYDLERYLAHLRNVAVFDPASVQRAYSALKPGAGDGDLELIGFFAGQVGEIESVLESYKKYVGDRAK